MELTSLTITEALELIQARQLSPVELTQAHIERIHRLDPELNSYLTVTAEEALERAKWAETQMMREVDSGPLLGIPLALKDLYETKGVRTTAGSKFFTDHIPEEDVLNMRLVLGG